MSELADVAGGETIASTFTNMVKERTVMRYASAAARDASIPAPIQGSLAFLESTKQITVYDSSQWVVIVDQPLADASYVKLVEPAQLITGDLDVFGELQVTEGGQSLLSPLVRDVVIDDGAPPFSVRGALWINQTTHQLFYSDGTQWVLAITGT